jgi:hypothetical protein
MKGGMTVSMAGGMIEIGRTDRLAIIAERGKSIVVVRGTIVGTETTGESEMAGIGMMRGMGSPVVSEKIMETDANGIEITIEIVSRREGESVPKVVMNAAPAPAVMTSEIIDDPMTEGEIEITIVDVAEKTMTDHPADTKNPTTRKKAVRVVDVPRHPPPNPLPERKINPKKKDAHEKNDLPAADDPLRSHGPHLLLRSPVTILAAGDPPHKLLPAEAVPDPALLHRPVAVIQTDIFHHIDPRRRL